MTALLSVVGNEVDMPAGSVDTVHKIGIVNTDQRAAHIIELECFLCFLEHILQRNVYSINDQINRLLTNSKAHPAGRNYPTEYACIHVFVCKKVQLCLACL